MTPPVGFRPVQLATLVDTAPAGDDWLHETKYDGYRCLLVKDGARITAYTRYGNDWSERFRTIVEAGAALPARTAVLDGEVVVLGAGGRSDFAKLQNAMREAARLDFYAFDLLAVDGEELAGRPLAERKARLETLLNGLPRGSRLHYSAHRVGGGAEALAEACQRKLEGIIAKRADAPYAAGQTRYWLKSKCPKWRKANKDRWRIFEQA